MGQPTGFENALGLSIKKRRTALGLSQENLAEKTSLHRTYIGSIERGERNVSLVNIVVIARALEWSAWELLQESKL